VHGLYVYVFEFLSFAVNLMQQTIKSTTLNSKYCFDKINNYNMQNKKVSATDISQLLHHSKLRYFVVIVTSDCYALCRPITSLPDFPF